MQNDLLFHQLYSNYMRAASEILTYACKNGGITRDMLQKIIAAVPFDREMSDFQAFMTDRYLLYPAPNAKDRFLTPIRHVPQPAVTTLERRWLCAMLQDPRVRLFCDEPSAEFDGVEPLFSLDRFVWYDRYADGDDYGNPTYRANFRTVLQAIRERRFLIAEYRDAAGRAIRFERLIPYRLEYSEKDDKFRLITASDPAMQLNLSRFVACTLGEPVPDAERIVPVFEMETMVLELCDTHNALERVMLHFSDLEKETRALEDGRYELRLVYRRDDEAEILIRILSFGAALHVLSPSRLVSKIKERLAIQAKRFLPDA